MALTVIVGVVDSPEGGAALDRAVDEVRLRGGTLVVVHSSRGGHEELEDVIAWQERLEETDRRLTDDGIPHRVHDYVRGNSPADDILQAATDEGADLSSSAFAIAAQSASWCSAAPHRKCCSAPSAPSSQSRRRATSSTYGRGRQSLDGHATYIVAIFVAGASR